MDKVMKILTIMKLIAAAAVINVLGVMLMIPIVGSMIIALVGKDTIGAVTMVYIRFMLNGMNQLGSGITSEISQAIINGLRASQSKMFNNGYRL